MTSHANVREARELYELKEQASKWYAKNGVPQKMEDVLNSMFYDQPTDVFGHLAEYFQGFSKPAVVSKVKACPALDSKGQMTLQTEVFCTVNNKQKLMSTNVCPSTSSHLLEIAKAEDKEEEDKEREEHLTAAIKHINNALGDKVKGLNPVNQRDLDDNICQFISELKKLEEDRLAKQASEQEVETEGAESELEKKPSSALSKPKSGGNLIEEEDTMADLPLLNVKKSKQTSLQKYGLIRSTSKLSVNPRSQSRVNSQANSRANSRMHSSMRVDRNHADE